MEMTEKFTGIRWNILGVIHTFDRKPNDPPGFASGGIAITHEQFKSSVPYSELSHQIHVARLKYGENNVMLEPALLIEPGQIGF